MQLKIIFLKNNIYQSKRKRSVDAYFYNSPFFIDCDSLFFMILIKNLFKNSIYKKKKVILS